MRIIISPAKTMVQNTDVMNPISVPVYLDETRCLLQCVKKMTLEECQNLWSCSDDLARENYERMQNMNLDTCETPAIFAYEGIQYQYMTAKVMETEEYAYLQEHLRILSGFYGVLRPLDGIGPYRLEMQANLAAGGMKNLYQFWGDKLYRSVMEDNTNSKSGDRIVINLASKEYSKCVEKYLGKEDCMITITFGELADGKVKQKGTYAKMARGEMVYFMAHNRVLHPEQLQEYRGLGYVFSEEYSSEREYVFLREIEKNKK